MNSNVNTFIEHLMQQSRWLQSAYASFFLAKVVFLVCAIAIRFSFAWAPIALAIYATLIFTSIVLAIVHALKHERHMVIEGD